jgi:hypothetical protein
MYYCYFMVLAVLKSSKGSFYLFNLAWSCEHLYYYLCCIYIYHRILNGNDAVSDQKISKFFVSHMEDSMAGHVGVMEFIKS